MLIADVSQIPREQAQDIGRAVVAALDRYYSCPENAARFEAWANERIRRQETDAGN